MFWKILGNQDFVLNVCYQKGVGEKFLDVADILIRWWRGEWAAIQAMLWFVCLNKTESIAYCPAVNTIFCTTQMTPHPASFHYSRLFLMQPLSLQRHGNRTHKLCVPTASCHKYHTTILQNPTVPGHEIEPIHKYKSTITTATFSLAAAATGAIFSVTREERSL